MAMARSPDSSTGGDLLFACPSPVGARVESAALLQRRRGRAALHVLERLRARRAPGSALTTDAVAAAADAEGLPRALLLGAASYFAELGFARRGRRHVRVCGGTACFAASSGAHIPEVEDALGVRRGECAPDGGVSLEEVRCLGCCYAGPSALDGDELRAGPELAAQLAGAADVLVRPIPVRSALADPVLLAGIIGGARSWTVWPAVARDGEAGVRRILSEVEASGLKGRGGAGFPVAAKWRSAIAHPPPRVVVANGDEGDPGSFADRLLLERDPERVLEGLALAGFACGARLGLVYVRSEYPDAQSAVRAAVLAARGAGRLGSEVGFDVEVVSGEGSYVTGEETGLIHALEGLRGTVKARPPYPTEQGWLGYPTVVNNVETLAAVPWIVARGASAYARLGSADEAGTKLLSLSERFARPGVVEVELGISLREVVEELGGGLRDGAQLRAVQVGGPLGGVIAAGSLDVRMTSLALAAAGAALGHGGIVAFDGRIGAPELLEHVWSFAAAESCGACSAVPAWQPPRRRTGPASGRRRGQRRARRAVRGDDRREPVRIRPDGPGGGEKRAAGLRRGGDEPMRVSVDGNTVEVGAGASILDAIRAAAVELPTLCFDERISPRGSCRTCLVIVDAGEPVAACTTPAHEGARVATADLPARNAARGALELILASLPARALEMAPECSELVAACGLLGPDPHRFGPPALAHSTQLDESHPYIRYDPALCIACERCVRMCDEVQGTFALDDGRSGLGHGDGARWPRLGLVLVRCVRRLRRQLPDAGAVRAWRGRRASRGQSSRPPAATAASAARLRCTSGTRL